MLGVVGLSQRLLFLVVVAVADAPEHRQVDVKYCVSGLLAQLGVLVLNRVVRNAFLNHSCIFVVFHYV